MCDERRGAVDSSLVRRRFEEFTGKLNQGFFEQSYGFLADMQSQCVRLRGAHSSGRLTTRAMCREMKRLESTLRKERDPEERQRLHATLDRLVRLACHISRCA
jgi:hypothetical protein